MNKSDSTSPIAQFSLQELIALSGGGERQGLMGECIAATTESHLEAFRYPCRIDAFIIGVGTEGETTVSVNMQEHALKKDTMFFFGPDNIVQIHSDNRFKAHALAISSEFMRHVNIDIKNMMPLFLQFAEHPSLELTPAESQTLRSFIALVEHQIQGSETPYAREVISSLIAASVYKVGDILHHYLAEHPDLTNPIRERSEAYFKQFTQLLSEHFREQRSVNFYAGKLCITPKYLTTIIKRLSGKSVSQWIDSYVILEAKTLLRHSHMSIQQVAYSLNFPNQSFFGSYFKRNTGLSPSQYREQD